MPTLVLPGGGAASNLPQLCITLRTSLASRITRRRRRSAHVDDAAKVRGASAWPVYEKPPKHWLRGPRNEVILVCISGLRPPPELRLG